MVAGGIHMNMEEMKEAVIEMKTDIKYIIRELDEMKSNTRWRTRVHLTIVGAVAGIVSTMIAVVLNLIWK